MKKYKVCLCKGCIEDLKEYNPFVCPIENLDITLVDVENCDNTTFKDVERNKDWTLE